jgi:hypothetical protein
MPSRSKPLGKEEPAPFQDWGWASASPPTIAPVLTFETRQTGYTAGCQSRTELRTMTCSPAATPAGERYSHRRQKKSRHGRRPNTAVQIGFAVYAFLICPKASSLKQPVSGLCCLWPPAKGRRKSRCGICCSTSLKRSASTDSWWGCEDLASLRRNIHSSRSVLS